MFGPQVSKEIWFVKLVSRSTVTDLREEPNLVYLLTSPSFEVTIFVLSIFSTNNKFYRLQIYCISRLRNVSYKSHDHLVYDDILLGRDRDWRELQPLFYRQKWDNDCDSSFSTVFTIWYNLLKVWGRVTSYILRSVESLYVKCLTKIHSTLLLHSTLSDLGSDPEFLQSDSSTEPLHLVWKSRLSSSGTFIVSSKVVVFHLNRIFPCSIINRVP